MTSSERKFMPGSLSAAPWHPILFAAFPVLSLLAYNITEIHATEALRSLVISCAAAVLLFLFLNLILKDRRRAAAISTIGIILFFFYGHIYHFLEPIQIGGIFLGRHRVLAPIFLAVGVLAGWALVKLKGDLGLLTRTLNIIAVSAVLFPIFQTFTYYASEKAAAPDLAAERSTLAVAQGESLPDIYYIILDGYSRDDVLNDYFHYDNSAFLNELAGLGFVVSHCSLSNYAQTQLSLASALNMNYLDALGKGFDQGRTDRVGMPGLIKRSAVREQLEALGYTTVAFETGYYWTQIEDAGVYISPKSSAASLLDITGGLNGFEALLIQDSASLILVDGASALPGFLKPDLEHPHEIHRQRVLFTLDQLEKLPSTPGPIFVFAHIVSPHKPFVFGPNGETAVEEDEKTAYRDQLAYLNSRILPVLQKIISNSTTPPVIILQGDHGGVETTGEDRMAILNAYYLPDGGEQVLYEWITPVNSFRLIFDHYFGGSYDRLEDASYFSDYKNPFKYTEVRNSRPGCP